MKKTSNKEMKQVYWDLSMTNPRDTKKMKRESRPSSVQRVLKVIRSRLQQGEQTELFRDLEIYGVGLGDFFSKQASSILSQAVIIDSTITLFTFVVDHMQKELFASALQENDFHILERFITQQQECEKRGWYTEQEEQLRIEKFTLLLKKDQDDVVHFMQQNTAQSYMTEGVIQEYKHALKSLDVESNHLPNLMPT